MQELQRQQLIQQMEAAPQYHRMDRSPLDEHWKKQMLDARREQQREAEARYHANRSLPPSMQHAGEMLRPYSKGHHVSSSSALPGVGLRLPEVGKYDYAPAPTPAPAPYPTPIETPSQQRMVNGDHALANAGSSDGNLAAEAPVLEAKSPFSHRVKEHASMEWEQGHFEKTVGRVDGGVDGSRPSTNGAEPSSETSDGRLLIKTMDIPKPRATNESNAEGMGRAPAALSVPTR